MASRTVGSRREAAMARTRTQYGATPRGPSRAMAAATAAPRAIQIVRARLRTAPRSPPPSVRPTRLAISPAPAAVLTAQVAALAAIAAIAAIAATPTMETATAM